jgi:hypothetical protein
MKELSVAEQRYQAVLAVIGDGLTVSQAAEKTGWRSNASTAHWHTILIR